MKSYLIVTLPFVIGVPLAVLIATAIQRRRNPPTPEALEAAAALGDRKWLRSGGLAFLFVIVYEVVYWVQHLGTLSAGLQRWLIVAPVACFLWFATEFVKELRSGDEFERRVQGEASSMAIGMFLGWAMFMWVTEQIWPSLHRGTFSAAIAFLPLNYAFSLFVTKGRYIPFRRARQ